MKIVIALIVGLIAAPILFGIAAVAGFLPQRCELQPAGLGDEGRDAAVDASLEKRADGLKNPVVPNDAAAMAAGHKIYATNCAGCHGSAKGPSDWGAKGLYPRAPQFFQEGSDVSPTEAFAAIHDGIRYSGMGAWRGQLKDDDMWKVANFVGRHPRQRRR